MTRTTLAALTATILATTGCTTTANEAGPAPTVTVTVTETTTIETTVTAEPTPEPEPEATPDETQGMLNLGDTVQFDGIKLTVTQNTVKTTFGNDPVRAWEVQACNTGNDITNFSTAAWFGVTAAGGRIAPSYITGDRDLEPTYPDSFEAETMGRTEPGECLIGFIAFSSDQITELRYRNYKEEAAVWDVSDS